MLRKTIQQVGSGENAMHVLPRRRNALLDGDDGAFALPVLLG